MTTFLGIIYYSSSKGSSGAALAFTSCNCAIMKLDVLSLGRHYVTDIQLL